MKKYNITKPIYPNLTDKKFNEIENVLGKFNIELGFLVDEGLEFKYNPEQYEAKNYPGDLTFYDVKTKSPVITYIEDLDDMVFKDNKDNIILTIPIYNELW